MAETIHIIGNKEIRKTLMLNKAYQQQNRSYGSSMFSLCMQIIHSTRSNRVSNTRFYPKPTTRKRIGNNAKSVILGLYDPNLI